MSCWTHIVAVIDVDTNIKEKNIKEVVENMLKDAPKITGSERNADIFVNVLSGYNVSMGADCEHCKYKNTIIHHKTGGFTCEADDDYECPKGEYQTRVIITVAGNLRDRLKEQTKREYKEFYNYLKKNCRFNIKNKTVNIIGW